MYSERLTAREQLAKAEAGTALGGQMYANQINPSHLAQAPDANESTLGNTVDRLNGLMHAIGDDLVQIHIAMFGPEPTGNEKCPAPSVALEGRLGYIVRLAEAIAQETAILRRRIG